MKKTFSIIFAAAALLLSATVSNAQNRGPYLTNAGKDNWFIGFNAGVNTVYDNLSFADIAPAVDVNFGKWFTPSVGFRAGYHGLQANPAVSSNWFSGDETFFSHFAHVDGLWNLANAFGGYKANRVWNPVVYLQAGPMFFHQEDNHRLTFGLGAGFMNQFRLGNHVSLALDLSAVVASERAMRTNHSGRFVTFPSATIGFVFDLGKRSFERPAPVVAGPDPSVLASLREQVGVLNEKIAESDRKAAALAGQLAKYDNLTSGKTYDYNNGVFTETVIEEAAPATPEILYFDLGKTSLSERELARLDYYAEHTFNKEQKLLISGGADAGTGSKEVNDRLSKQRAEYVKNILVLKFGFNPANLETKADVIPSDSPIKGRIVTIEVK